jgi:GDP-4-dehydro-6-deoxy-D-mannose reductase
VTTLVTGAAGFVGPHLLQVLKGRGDEVHGLGSERSGPPGFERWFVADLRDPEALEAAVRQSRPDSVIHLAAQSSTARSFEAPVETFEINALGTWRLLDAVRRSRPGARVLVVGTGDVYGPQPEGTRVAETAPFRPVSPYAFSKAAADATAEVAHRAWGLDAVRVRAFGHAGPGQSERFVVAAIAAQVARAELDLSEPVVRVGNLDVVRDVVDVRDVVGAYQVLLERGAAGSAYNVCRGDGVRLADIARRLLALAKRPLRLEVDAARLRPADVPYLVGDPSRIALDTGWRPALPLEQTLVDVLDDWRGRLATAVN